MYESKPYFYGTGRRKHSVARVRVYQGTGKITINGRDIDDYFGLDTLKAIARQPLALTETEGKFGGAGALVPITGFANSVAAPAVEFKKEGQVFGIGCKIFTIAGPVILYGIFTSWLLGLFYFLYLFIL